MSVITSTFTESCNEPHFQTAINFGLEMLIKNNFIFQMQTVQAVYSISLAIHSSECINLNMGRCCLISEEIETFCKTVSYL